jgi:type IV pilus assembly protein PilC
LTRLAHFREKAAAVRAKVIGAMIYPAIVALVATLVVSGVVVWIIPKFRDIFASFDAELPRTTRTLLAFSGAVVRYWYVFFGVPVLAAAVHLWSLRRSEPYRFAVNQFLLRLPAIGTVLRKSTIAAFARTFGTLIESGVPHLDALEIVRDTSSSAVLRRGVEQIRRTVREGEGIARPMGESGAFDDLVVNMVDVGEATGELDGMLLKVAGAYEIAVDRSVDALFKVIEPALLVAMAVVVGFIVVALFMPLLSIMNQLGSQ